MAGMDLWVAYITAFEKLDRYINQGRDHNDLKALVTQFEQSNPAFGGTPIPLGPSLTTIQQHFQDDWIGQAGSGGLYWPYLNAIDVGAMFHCAFEVSVRLLATARHPGLYDQAVPPRPIDQQFDKHHMTIWICALPTPSQFDQDNIAQRADPQEQEKLFRIAVVEYDHAVLVVISTPEPIGDAVVEQYLGLSHAFPIKHWRVTIIDGNCVWSQCVHPMLEPIGDPPEGVSFGEGPPASGWQITVPGDFEVPPLPTR